MTQHDAAAAVELADAYVAELHDGRLAYRPAEAARLLGVDVRTVYRLIANGHLQARRESGRLTLIPRAALFEFLGVDDTAPQPLTGVVAPQEVLTK